MVFLGSDEHSGIRIYWFVKTDTEGKQGCCKDIIFNKLNYNYIEICLSTL